MNAAEDDTLQMQLVSVPDEKHMLTPGEVRQVALDYFLFHSILQTGSTLFGCVKVNDWSTSPDVRTRGTMLSILSIKNVLQDTITEVSQGDVGPPPPKIMVECRCSGRFDVLQLMDGSCGNAGSAGVPEAWKLVHGECVPVRDWACWNIADRRQLAAIEWNVWQSCKQVASMMRKLRAPQASLPLVEQELMVWAPKEYDRDIAEDEWAQTPLVTRGVWCQRAESFSFGILRCMESDENTMGEARRLTNTIARLEMAQRAVEKKRAMTRAELSLKNAFN